MDVRCLLLATGAVAAFALGACDDSARIDPIEGKWVLIEGTSLGGYFTGVRSFAVTMESDAHGNEGVVGGLTPCNKYGFRPSYGGGAIVGEGVDRTLQGCRGSAGEVESLFLETLALVDGAVEEGDRLTLTGPDVRLLFERAD